jgi:DNA-binding CsgD family transcriptional regulator
MGVAGEALTGAETRRVRERLLDLSRRGLPAPELFERVGKLLHQVVPFDASGWMTTDPATGLFTGIGGLTGMTAQAAHVFFENEIVEPDLHKFADLARALEPVALLADASRGDAGAPSMRQRTIYPSYGLGPELRASFALDSVMWGSVCLSRTTGSPDFTAAEARFVSALAEPLALALRGALLLEADSVVADGAPGILMVTADGQLESATPPAEQWLAQLDDDPLVRRGEGLPAAVHAVAMRALAEGSDPHVARVRLRTSAGVWLTLYASPLAGADGRRRAAVVIEPARRAEVAPVVAQAYDLSPREREVLALIAQGMAVDAIARKLVISLYTARDHVKRIQSKVRVTSRAELVSKLFVDHYAPQVA